MFEGCEKEYLGVAGSSNSALPIFESVASIYGGKFVNYKFDFSDNPKGGKQLQEDLGYPDWWDEMQVKKGGEDYREGIDGNSWSGGAPPLPPR